MKINRREGILGVYSRTVGITVPDDWKVAGNVYFYNLFLVVGKILCKPEALLSIPAEPE